MKDEEKRVMRNPDRTGKLVEGSSHKVQEVGSLENRDDANKFNLAMDDENIDFNISGVPNAMVQRSQSISVQNLIQKIESHPQREALQNDLQQHRAFNPFSKESKDAVMAAGNAKLCEIIDMEPKSQGRACSTHWSAELCTAHVDTLWQMILPKTKSTSQLCWICSPSRTFTSGKADHTVTGTGKHLVAKNTTQLINFKRGVARRNMTTSTTDSSATSSSEKRWLSWVALKRSSLRWIGLQAKTTVILPHKKKLMSIVATGGSVRMWWISIWCRQGVNLISRKHCRHCTASSKRRTRSTMKSGHKVPPHGGNGKQTGGNPIMRIHHKDGVTTDWTGKPVYSVGNYSFAVWISATIECKNYREYIGYSWQQSTVTDGVCKYNTSWYRNSRTNDYDKWLRKSVYDDKHIFNNGETIVDNYVNDVTHVDTHKMQTWAHLHAVCSCIAWFVHITFHLAQAARTCLP